MAGYLHSARTRSFSSTNDLKLSLLSCLTSDAPAMAAKKAAQIVVYFILAVCMKVCVFGCVLRRCRVECLCECVERVREPAGQDFMGSGGVELLENTFTFQ